MQRSVCSIVFCLKTERTLLTMDLAVFHCGGDRGKWIIFTTQYSTICRDHNTESWIFVVTTIAFSQISSIRFCYYWHDPSRNNMSTKSDKTYHCIQFLTPLNVINCKCKMPFVRNIQTLERLMYIRWNRRINLSQLLNNAVPIFHPGEKEQFGLGLSLGSSFITAEHRSVIIYLVVKSAWICCIYINKNERHIILPLCVRTKHPQ